MVTLEPKKKIIQKVEKKTKKDFVLDDKNAIPFLFEYGNNNKENKVRISTIYGDIDVELFKDTPYHRANFIYLIKKKYFQGEYFHRVVKDFIIQGGNSDNISTSKKRRKIGRYLLPPDTKKVINIIGVLFQCQVVKLKIHINLHLLLNFL